MSPGELRRNANPTPRPEPRASSALAPRPGVEPSRDPLASLRGSLTRLHLPLAEAPSPATLRAWAARCEAEAEAWIAWHDPHSGLSCLGGGALSCWDFAPREAFSEAAALCSSLRERVVDAQQVDAQQADAQILATLPLVWHGFAFRAGVWLGEGEAAPEAWPGGEARLPSWLLYRAGAQAGLVLHAWSDREDPSALRDRLAARARDLLCEPEPGPPQGPPATISPSPAEAERFRAAVGAASAAMRAGGGRKVVLSRRCEARAPQGARFDAPATWEALCAEPGARAFAWSRGAEGALVGASPELLVACEGRAIRSEALAGTAPREQAEALLTDPKNLREHALVRERIACVLRERCGPLTLPPGPRLRRLGRLAHLQTPLAAERCPGRPEHELLALGAALHPTPALGGDPRSFARAWLRDEQRGWFGAPLGYSSRSGEGLLLVTIRSALLRDERAELFAGAGILAESEPEAEWRETELKLGAAATALRLCAAEVSHAS